MEPKTWRSYERRTFFNEVLEVVNKTGQCADANPKIQKVPSMLRDKSDNLHQGCFHSVLTTSHIALKRWQYRSSGGFVLAGKSTFLPAPLAHNSTRFKIGQALEINLQVHLLFVQNIEEWYKNENKILKDLNHHHVHIEEEITRLNSQGSAIASLERKLENAQKSIDILVSSFTNSEDTLEFKSPEFKTQFKKKKTHPFSLSNNANMQIIIRSPCSPLSSSHKVMECDTENKSPNIPQSSVATPPKCHDNNSCFSSREGTPITRQTNSVDVKKMQRMFKNAAEENIRSIRAYPSTTRCLGDFGFNDSTLKLPPNFLEESTARIFLNMLGYEMCPNFENESAVSTYMYFMDELIDGTQDVEELTSEEWYKNENKILKDLNHHHVHLLDLLLKKLIQPLHQIDHEKRDLKEIIIDRTIFLCNKLKCNRNDQQSIRVPRRNIGKLREAGINLKPSKTSCLGDFSFSDDTLKLPPIFLEESTARIFLNMLGYKMCHDFDNKSKVSTYMYFMDELIDGT
ncbi:hypothetical protein LWI29_000377 [Acer saccharum]|uniref:Uncharacterized protein n=1 Tax=Acer saccharum TaxID=4024 RepID=A0AA39RB18_ACESA|nr:hypothetical protein LWI29_000377 [Acer saccharum]